MPESNLQRLKDAHPDVMEGVRFEMGPLKTWESAQKKLPDYDGDHRQIKDLTRGRFVTQTPEQIQLIKQELSNLNLAGMNNKYEVPSETGYRDLNTKVVLPNGHIGEIQVQQEDMLRVNKQTHTLMKEANRIKELAQSENRPFTPEEVSRRNVLKTQAIELHNAAAYDGKINSLLDPDVKTKFIYTGPVDNKGRALNVILDKLGDVGKSNKNIVLDVGIAAAVGAASLAAGASPAEAAYNSGQTLNPIPETTDALLHGESGVEVVEAAVQDASAWAGCVAGGYAVGKLGFMGGSAVNPGLGTAIGTGVGAIVGCAGCAWVASEISDRIFRFFAGDETQDVTLDEIREILPEKSTPDMPPEFQALVEVQSSDALMQDALDNLREDGSCTEYMVPELWIQNQLYTQQQLELEQALGIDPAALGRALDEPKLQADLAQEQADTYNRAFMQQPATPFRSP